MSDMRKLLESINRFAGEPEQKSGDQVRGTDKPKKSDKKHAFGDRLVGEDLEYYNELMTEYKLFAVENPLQGTDQADQPASPVANINPAGQGTAVTNTNPALQAQDDEKTQNGQQTPQQKQAMNLKQTADLRKTMTALQSIDPNINVQKATTAINKDPAQATTADTDAMKHVINAIKPVLQDPNTAAGLKSSVQRLMPKGPK